MSFIPCKDVS